MRKRWLVITLVVSLSGLSGAGPGPTAGGVSSEDDFRTPDTVLRALYESLTFPEGGSPDLARFAGLFASPTSPCIRTTPGAALTADLQGFLENFGQRVRTGAVRSFREEEISRRLMTYGDIAQAFSIYRKTVNSSGPQGSTRGVNSLQLSRFDGRWRITCLMWQDETAGLPIPEEYLAGAGALPVRPLTPGAIREPARVEGR